MSDRCSSFSGGWRVRLNLARALMAPSDLLLLDEPTNHLDLDAVLWLEEWLRRYPGTLLIISHDREFLDGVISHTMHLHDGTAKLYAGNYSAFERQRAEHLRQQQIAHEREKAERAHLQSFIDRFKAKASKAKQAQSRMKRLEKWPAPRRCGPSAPSVSRSRRPTGCRPRCCSWITWTRATAITSSCTTSPSGWNPETVSACWVRTVPVSRRW